MGTPEQFLRTKLELATAVNAYPLNAPATAVPPFCIFSRTSTTRERQLDTVVGTPMGVFSVEIYSDGYSDGKVLADLARVALNEFAGESDGLTVQNVSLAEEGDNTPVYLDGHEIPTYVITQTYTVVWEE